MVNTITGTSWIPGKTSMPNSLSPISQGNLHAPSSLPRAAFDLESLHRVKDPREKLKTVAIEMESIFVKMMMKSIADTVPQSGLIDRQPAERIFEEMLLGERSRNIAQHQSMGIARMIYEQNIKYLSERNNHAKNT